MKTMGHRKNRRCLSLTVQSQVSLGRAMPEGGKSLRIPIERTFQKLLRAL
jgi:hypothetical protein